MELWETHSSQWLPVTQHEKSRKKTNDISGFDKKVKYLKFQSKIFLNKQWASINQYNSVLINMWNFIVIENVSV